MFVIFIKSFSISICSGLDKHLFPYFAKPRTEDELFLVIKGKLKIELRDKTIEIDEGEFIIVPHGVEHRPVADEEVHILLFEPASTLNTGNVQHEMTRTDLEKL